MLQQANMPYTTISSRQLLKKELDPILQNGTSLDNKTHAPGIIYGVTNEKETVYLNHSGYLNLETKDSVNNDSKFAMLSATKPISTLAILQLVDRNLVDLDTPVEKYLPRFASVAIFKGGNGDKASFFKAKKEGNSPTIIDTHSRFRLQFH